MFPITTYAVTTRVENVITAVAPGVSLRNDFALYPLLAGIGLERNPVKGGNPVQAGVFLNSRAPMGGLAVSVSSNNPAAVVPPTVTVPAGSTVGYFVITTTAVGANTPVGISATHAGATSSATLQVTP